MFSLKGNQMKIILQASYLAIRNVYIINSFDFSPSLGALDIMISKNLDVEARYFTHEPP